MASSTIEVKLISDDLAETLMRRIVELEDRITQLEAHSPYRAAALMPIGRGLTSGSVLPERGYTFS